MSRRASPDHPAEIDVHLCPNGCICLMVGVTAVHLQPLQFRQLALAVIEAAEAMGFLRRPEPGEARTSH